MGSKSSNDHAGVRLTAKQLNAALDEQDLPGSSVWETAPPVNFCCDWRGEHADPLRGTEARLLWSHERLFIRFRCRYREIYVYPEEIGRRDRLWLRDVAEVFIRSGAADIRQYKEFEISPNGDWLDLDICSGNKSILFCDLKSRVAVNPAAGLWTAELSLPMDSLTEKFDPGETWHLNLFRIEGREPDRF